MDAPTIYETTRQTVDISDLALSGRILDIGGGGEGIIARRCGNSVAVIDIRPEELVESPDAGLKIIMDARKLQFLNEYFDNITCFYSLMYMGSADIAAFLSEAYRVLKAGARLWIWDAVIPAPPMAAVYVAQLEVKLSEHETITTGYGVGWKREQSLASVLALCGQAGFTAISQRESGDSFFLCCEK